VSQGQLGVEFEHRRVLGLNGASAVERLGDAIKVVVEQVPGALNVALKCLLIVHGLTVKFRAMNGR
jgi:hypothetical protein